MAKIININGKPSFKTVDTKIHGLDEYAEALDDWKQKERRITMTNGDWELLTGYIRLSAGFIQNQIDGWARLSEQKGTSAYPNAKDNYEKLKAMYAAAGRFIAEVEG